MERGLWSFLAGNEEVPAETATAAARNSYRLRSDKARLLKTVAIDIPGGKRSLVKNIIAQTTIIKRAIKKI